MVYLVRERAQPKERVGARRHRQLKVAACQLCGRRVIEGGLSCVSIWSLGAGWSVWASGHGGQAVPFAWKLPALLPAF